MKLIAAIAAVLLSPPFAVGAAPQNAFSFTVDVSLSPTAAAKLRSLSERITVAASYFGDPSPSAERYADEVGQIDLGRSVVEISGAGGAVLIDGAVVKRRRLAWLTAAPPEVNVNVYSARHSGPDNILDCAFFQDTVAVARQRPVKLACKLIGEP